MAPQPESTPASRVSPPNGKSTLEDRLIARILARSLDRELAAGTPSSLSDAHAARAEQLADDRARRAVARSLESLLGRAAKPRATFLLPTIPPCRDQILEAAPLIGAIASRLRSADSVDFRAVARLKQLATDRSGPCYDRTRPDALAVLLGELAASLASAPRADKTRR